MSKMRRARTSGMLRGSTVARPGEFHGPAVVKKHKKITPASICTNTNCGHFRSEHPGKGACEHEGCECEAFAFDDGLQEEHRKFPPLTEAELARAKQMLEDGATYSEVARTLQRSAQGIRIRLPGHGTNMTERYNQLKEYDHAKLERKRKRLR